uniref:Cytochrome P450, family 4, subfamily T, polypeptide 8 n=1 Tax=Lepisosteus oculatus TaxID=7918 RepID=W5MPS7_LEPOC
MELFEIRNISIMSFDPSRLYSLIAVFLLVTVTFKLSKLFNNRKQALKILESFPGPPTHWLYGHVHEFPQDGNDLDKTTKWADQYPYAFPLWFGPFVPFLNINHPEYAKTILSSTEPKDDISYRFLIPWIGEGLLVTDKQKWFRHRRLLTPGFHYDVLKQYVKFVADSTKSMLEKWEMYAGKEESFEVFQHASLMTLDSIMKSAFSCTSNCQTESGKNTYIKTVYEICNIINLRFRFFPYHSEILFYISNLGYRFRKACKIAHQHTDEVIKQRKEALKDEKELDKIHKKRNLDFLDILLCARDEENNSLSDEDIR